MLLQQAFPQYGRRNDLRFLPPKGTLSPDFEKLKADKCIQAETDSLRGLFAMLMGLTGCNPCNGCPVWERQGPACKAFQNNHSAYQAWKSEHEEEIKEYITPCNAPRGHKFDGMNMKQIAAELGVSLSEVRRLKADGTLFT